MTALTPRTNILDTDRFSRAEVSTATGDTFSVATWAGECTPVFAVHGISSNQLLWSWTAAADADLHLIAPDLRGRGESLKGGPFGLAQHRDDMLAVMDALGLERVVLVGMSLGGYVATAMAALAPERFSAVVLVDGGIPVELPDAVRDAVLDQLEARGASTETFNDIASYAATYFAAVGQSLDQRDPLIRALMSWNLDATDTGFSVRLPAEAMAVDSRDVFGGAPLDDWLGSLQMPVHLLHAASPLGDLDVAGWVNRLPQMTETFVDDVDHASIIMTHEAGARVAEAIRHCL